MRPSTTKIALPKAILLTLAACAAGYGLGATARPQDRHPASAEAGGAPHGHSSPPSEAKSPATDEYAAAMSKMHRDMNVAPTGDPDEDFARGMLTHHVGAVDMARIELRHGRDPEMRSLARAVIASQQPEIDQMRAWLARRVPQPAPSASSTHHPGH